MRGHWIKPVEHEEFKIAAEEERRRGSIDGRKFEENLKLLQVRFELSYLSTSTLNCLIPGKFVQYRPLNRSSCFLSIMVMNPFPIPQKGSGLCSYVSAHFLANSCAATLPSNPILPGTQSSVLPES